MSIISLPASVRIRHIEWQLDRPAQINRGAYSGSRVVVANPWHGKWSASVQLAPIIGEANVRGWRGFLASLKGQINTFLLPATEGLQVSGGPLTAASNAAQGANSITLNPVLGSDIIAADGLNGSFTSDVAGWTNYGPGTFSWIAAGDARIVATGGNTTVQLPNISGLAAGSKYRLSVTATALSPGGSQWVVSAGGATGSGYGNDGSANAFATGTATLDFLPTFGATESVAVTVASGATLDISSVKVQQNTTPQLKAGMLATVTLPSGNRQLVMLTQDMSSAGVITFEPALREAISSGASVEIGNPACLVALDASAFKWSVDPGQLYNISFGVEEAF